MDKTKKAIGLLHCFKTSVGQLWGPSPFLIRWVFTGILRPKIMYRAIVWVNKAVNYTRNLDRIQRHSPAGGLLPLTCLLSEWELRQHSGSRAGTRAAGMALTRIISSMVENSYKSTWGMALQLETIRDLRNHQRPLS